MATFPLELVTPERLLFSEEVQAIRAPGVEGSLGVQAGHAPLLTELITGLIKVTLADGRVLRSPRLLPLVTCSRFPYPAACRRRRRYPHSNLPQMSLPRMLRCRWHRHRSHL